jgi:hypothetical protein
MDILCVRSGYRHSCQALYDEGGKDLGDVVSVVPRVVVDVIGGVDWMCSRKLKMSGFSVGQSAPSLVYCTVLASGGCGGGAGVVELTSPSTSAN